MCPGKQLVSKNPSSLSGPDRVPLASLLRGHSISAFRTGEFIGPGNGKGFRELLRLILCHLFSSSDTHSYCFHSPPAGSGAVTRILSRISSAFDHKKTVREPAGRHSHLLGSDYQYSLGSENEALRNIEAQQENRGAARKSLGVVSKSGFGAATLQAPESSLKFIAAAAIPR